MASERPGSSAWATAQASISATMRSGHRVPTQLLPEAPVGHRQPRADQVPPEKNLMDPNDPVNQENAALDRMINGICRGC
jgi:hypothetical protein